MSGFSKNVKIFSPYDNDGKGTQWLYGTAQPGPITTATATPQTIIAAPSTNYTKGAMKVYIHGITYSVSGDAAVLTIGDNALGASDNIALVVTSNGTGFIPFYEAFRCAPGKPLVYSLSGGSGLSVWFNIMYQIG